MRDGGHKFFQILWFTELSAFFNIMHDGLRESSGSPSRCQSAALIRVRIEIKHFNRFPIFIRVLQ